MTKIPPKLSLFLIIIGLVLTTSRTAAQSIDDERADATLPTLRGDEAINELKENGQYDSLIEAFKAARKENGQTDETPTDDAVGQTARLTASDGGATDQFGVSVAISGYTAIVGAYQDRVGTNADQGSAYIFVRSGASWSQQQKLIASDGAEIDQFGISVAISGDTAIVGAHRDDVAANVDQGSAYVFVRSGTSWTQQAKVTASDGAANDYFGSSVAISAEKAIVGAHRDDVAANVDQGSAYIFARSGTSWSQQQKLTASDGAASDHFGISVGISGDTAIVGANGDEIGANDFQGSAYVFVRSGTSWTQQQKVTASDGAASDHFGSSVAISGETAIVGAIWDTVGANDRQGSAYIFVRSGTSWPQRQKLTASDGAPRDRFGASVAISGDTVIVGADGDEIGANGAQGSAYIFARSGTTWTPQQKVTASDGAANDNFGVSVAISGDTAIVGAYLDDVGTNFNQGSAYIYRALGSPGISDFDGDGKTDLSIFRPSNGQWWLNRSTAGLIVHAFGSSSDIPAPGDFTGDGLTDVAIFRPSNGVWFVLRSENFSFYSFPFGASGDVPVPGDYDGDGRTDAAVFRPSNATWYIQRSSGGTTIQTFGASTDRPVPADYDGDGKTDIAIFRPSNGQWWMSRSTAGLIVHTFGNSADRNVPGDYTGDGKAEVAIWRPSTGEWFILRSEDSSFYSFPFGTSADLPVPGDYDGDGRFDAGVFRPSNATWYLNRSTAGLLIQSFGAATDRPVPNASVR